MNQHHPKLDRQRNLTLRSRSSRVEPLGRSSLRSKGSSNSSEDKVKMFKNCVRKMIEFLFTQVGVGAVVVCFTIVGASIFQVCHFPHPYLFQAHYWKPSGKTSLKKAKLFPFIFEFWKMCTTHTYLHRIASEFIPWLFPIINSFISYNTYNVNNFFEIKISPQGLSDKEPRLG